MNKQMRLAGLGDELAQAQTRKKEFLQQMDCLIPWGKWYHIVKAHYYKAERGNKPYNLAFMLRIHVLQNLYDLSDMAVMTEVIDSRAFSEFCRVNSQDEVPDGDTIGRFRGILVKNGLQEKFFESIVELLQNKGLILRKGTIVDSTIISAPSSTKNLEKKRDPEAHIGVDKDSGLVHHIATTAANIHDVTMTAELLHGEEESVYGDAGYIGAQKRPEAVTRNNKGKNIQYKINRRPSQSKKKTNRSRSQIRRREREKSSVRSKVEHVFAVVKCLFHYRKTRYKGRRRQNEKLHMIFALANLYLAGKRFGLAV